MSSPEMSSPQNPKPNKRPATPAAPDCLDHLPKQGGPAPQYRQGVIFDLDGTLIDTAEDLAASMNYVLVNQGYAPIPHQDVRHLVGFGAKAMLSAGFQKSCGYTPTPDELTALATDFVDYYHHHIADFSKPFPHTLEALEQLAKNGIVLGVCTNKDETLARTLLSALKMTDYFAAIVGGNTAGIAKPDPAPVHLCLQQMGLRMDQPSSFTAKDKEDKTKKYKAIFIGDSDTDIKAAVASKLDCLIADFGYGPLDEIEQAHSVFSSYKQAPDIILEMLRA